MGDFKIFSLQDEINQDPHRILQKHGLPLPPAGIKVLKCKVAIPITNGVAPPEEGDELMAYWIEQEETTTSALSLNVYAWGDYVFVGDHHYTDISTYQIVGGVEEVEPFVEMQVIGVPEHRQVQVTKQYENQNAPYFSRWSSRTVSRLDTYNDRYDYDLKRHVPGAPWNFCKMKVTAGSVSQEVNLKIHRPLGGTLTLNQGSLDFKASLNFFGLPLTWTESLALDTNRYGEGRDQQWSKMTELLRGYKIAEGADALWTRFLDDNAKNGEDVAKVKGIEGRKAVKEVLARLRVEEPLLARFYDWLHESKTSGGTSNNTLLAAFLTKHGTDYDAVVAGLRTAMAAAPGKVTITKSWRSRRGGANSYSYEQPMGRREICLSLPGASEKNEEQRSKKEWNMRKGARNQAIGLGVSPEGHPTLLAAIEAQEIPLSLFHKHGDALALVNTEFDLWEMALVQPGWRPILSEIAHDASRRSKYEKDITPYLAFLFRLPNYLDRNTEPGAGWKMMPKFVKSEYELEMKDEEASEAGTTKRRSAMTPDVNNAKRTVVVPYVAMAISGIQTTYCYSLDYQVFETMDIDRQSSTPIVRELEKKLNGRDDYGMMYFTLTGTARNTGYPAFLIIFERRKTISKTHVHFHRVHPCRSKDGRETPASKLIEEGYRYMAGNIRAEEIFAQQGDLIFIKTDQKIEITDAVKPVKEFESHCFVPKQDKPVLLAPNTTKIKNRLGHLICEGIFMVKHPEHENIKAMPAGTYEVRRCKSYENNPTGVWVLNID
jgi:hypothetical protein